MDAAETFDPQEEQAFEPDAGQESAMESESGPAVAVAAPPPPPLTNGHVSQAPAGPTVQTQEIITHAPRPYVPPAPIHRRPLPPKKEDKNRTAREKLDRIVVLPESMDWELRVFRQPQGLYLPNSDPVKTGFLEAFDCMPFDSLKDTIGRLWGGGEYRIIPCTRNDHAPIINVPEASVIFMSLRVDDYPPKNGHPAAPSSDVVTATPPEENDEIKQERDNQRLSLEQLRSEQAAHKLKKARMVIEVEQLELEQRRQALLGNNNKKEDSNLALEMKLSEMRQAQEKAIDTLRQQQEKDREAAERRAKEDRDAADRKFDQLINKISEIANKPQPMPLAPVDKTPELIAAMGTMLQAIVPKQDNSQLQIAQMSQQQNERMFELAAKLTARENQQQAALMSELIKGRSGDSKQSSMQEIISILEYGRKLQDHTFKLAQGNAEETPAGPGWNPKIGVMGNIAQSFFGIISKAVESAAASPAAQQFLLNLFNKTNPSEAEQMAAAQELERRQIAQGMQPQAQLPMVGVPQVGVQGQQPMQQRPLVTPQFPTVPGISVPMRQGPLPTQPQRQQAAQPQRPPQNPQVPGMQVQQKVQPGPTQPAPASPTSPAVSPTAPATAPANGAPAAPAPEKKPIDPEEQAALTAKAAASDLESEVTGVSEVDLTAMSEPTPPSQPAPAPVAAPAQSISPPLSQEQPAIAQQPDESELRLRERVSEAMAIALDNVKDEISEHDWPELATAKWNGRFIQFLRQQVDDQHRAQVIGHYCDPQVWQTLIQALQTSTAEPPAWNSFFDGIRAVVAPRQ